MGPVHKKPRVEVKSKELAEFVPPSVSPLLIGNPSKVLNSIHQSYIYISQIPQEIVEHKGEPIILGIDEAGRGPVLGSMVYSLAFCLEKNLSILKDADFDDSKKLNDIKRTQLMCEISKKNTVLERNIGYGLTNLTARDISSEMLNSSNFNNLNNQAHQTTIDLITRILQLLEGYNPTEVYIDTVGPPVSYQEKLQKIFPSLKVTVSKKADSIYPIVSAASVVAKVTRDIALAKYNVLENKDADSPIGYGSGYPADPFTTAWLNSRINEVFGWSQIVRYSWQTTKTLLENKSKVQITWEDDIKKKKVDYGVDSFFGGKEEGVTTAWYGAEMTTI